MAGKVGDRVDAESRHASFSRLDIVDEWRNGATHFERARDETGWLERLSRIDVDTTLIWGLHDSVAPLRVANHVWQTYVKDKPGRNRYWVVPGADHYVQCDAPAEVAAIIRLTAASTDIALQTIGDRPEGAVLVDQSGRDGG